MGDGSNMADIERLIRSEEGKVYLGNIVASLKRRCIVDVSFKNETDCLSTILHLDDGSVFGAIQRGHEVDGLRERFQEVIEREICKDYPERKA